MIKINNFEFKHADSNQVTEIFSLIMQRIDWMNNNGIKQWNVTNYHKTYPIDYYAKKQIANELYVLVDINSNEVVAAAVLYETDKRWDDNSPALYLHNFVIKVDIKGVGTIFIDCAEQYAKKIGKDYFRLDSLVSNKAIGQYYTKLGYKEVGLCQDGHYNGILREKKL